MKKLNVNDVLDTVSGVFALGVFLIGGLIAMITEDGFVRGMLIVMIMLAIAVLRKVLN